MNKVTLGKTDQLVGVRETLAQFKVPYPTDAKGNVALRDVTKKFWVRFYTDGKVEVAIDLSGTGYADGPTRAFATMHISDFHKVEMTPTVYKGKKVVQIDCWGAPALHFMVKTWE